MDDGTDCRFACPAKPEFFDRSIATAGFHGAPAGSGAYAGIAAAAVGSTADSQRSTSDHGSREHSTGRDNIRRFGFVAINAREQSATGRAASTPQHLDWRGSRSVPAASSGSASRGGD